MGAGGVARKALQALEGLKLAEKDPNGGRRLTSQGRRDLDRIAAQIKLAAAEKAKKAAAAEAVISISCCCVFEISSNFSAYFLITLSVEILSRFLMSYVVAL